MLFNALCGLFAVRIIYERRMFVSFKPSPAFFKLPIVLLIPSKASSFRSWVLSPIVPQPLFNGFKSSVESGDEIVGIIDVLCPYGKAYGVGLDSLLGKLGLA